jgi:hypothetical protein
MDEIEDGESVWVPEDDLEEREEDTALHGSLTGSERSRLGQILQSDEQFCFLLLINSNENKRGKGRDRAG